MIRYILLYFTLLLFLLNDGIAQANIQFDSEFYDFGIFYEDDSEKSHDFRFVNVGTDSLEISTVEIDCGCAKPTWTKEMIAPGDSGVVTVSYDPIQKTGVFEKQIKLKVDEVDDQIVLVIKGNVLPAIKNALIRMNYKYDSLWSISKVLAFGNIANSTSATRSFQVYNAGSRDLTSSQLKFQSPPGVEVVLDSMIQSKHIGELKVTIDPEISGKLGYQSYYLNLILDSLQIIPFEVTVSVVDDLGLLDDEKIKRAPLLVFNQSSFDFGEATSGDLLTTSFMISNEGANVLEIKDFQTNCGCISVQLEKRTLRPHESMQMDVYFDTSGRHGRQYKTLTIFSNDPLAPTQTLMLKAYLD